MSELLLRVLRVKRGRGFGERPARGKEIVFVDDNRRNGTLVLLAGTTCKGIGESGKE